MNIEHKDAQIIEPDSGDEMPGSFEAILSTPSLDRDGDELKSEDWLTPLPARIPIDVDHGMSVVTTVGSAEPYFNEAGNLAIRGIFASTPLAQEVRTLVKEGHISSVSVGFMTHHDTKAGGQPGKRELLNAGIVNTPSNRDAIMLAAKAIVAKAGARHSAADMAHIQAIADHARALGAAGPMDDTQAEEGVLGGKAASPDFTPIPDGTEVTWDYRGATGHGTIEGVHKLGTTHDNTEYSIREHDHHVSASGSHEPSIVYHYGSDITVVHDGKSAGDVETKAKYDAEQLRRLLAEGHAMRGPDGAISYPIDDTDDLDNAIRGVGRGNADHDAIRRYIIGRAREMGQSDAIPDNWNTDGSLKSLAAAYVKAFIDADSTVTPGRLAQAVDASLDDCLLIISQLDRSALPPQVQQLCDTVTAAAECVDQLLDAMGVDDPDDPDDLDDEGAATGGAAPGDAGADAAPGDAAKSVDAEALDLQYKAMSLQLAAYTAD